MHQRQHDHRLPRTVVEQPSDASIRYIGLTHGQYAIVDAADYEELLKWNWRAGWDKGAKAYYAVCSQFLMHRKLLSFPEGMQVDHINHQTLDNRRANLRVATCSQNQFNRAKRCDNSSGYKGVFRIRSKTPRWMAGIKVERKRIYLGTFLTPEEAHAAYVDAAKKMHGEFANVA